MDGENGAKPKAVEAIALRIVFIPETGKIEVNGPLDDGQLFLGMLEMAKVIFYERRRKAADQRIVEIPPGLRL